MGTKKIEPSTRYAVYLALFYNVVGMIPFLLPSTVKDLWPGIKTENCPRRGPCTEAIEFTTAVIFMQVIVGVALMYACLVAIPGKNGLLAGLSIFICTMAKHLVVDGLTPPPPVMVMTAATLAAVVAAPGEWGKRAFVAFCLINAFTFVTNPLMVMQDTWPEITAGSEAAKVGTFELEVVALYALMSAIVAATPNRALGLAYSWQVVLPVLGKHVILDKSGPPAPMSASILDPTPT